ncbi:MAG TPA: NADH:ubiquinone oxidoreductase [Acidobacteriota bacterium]|nr:NADH:ubiquinone oxidoreductase [Acidobacteriota bacterium]
MAKPKVAFFDFSCCEGCQLTVSNCEDELLDLVSHIDIVNFREIMTERSDDYDIAFIEGSCTREEEVARLQKIRENAQIVIALGACATIGGINCLKNFHNLDEVRQTVYGDKAHYFPTWETRPIDRVIKVDYHLHGCPIDRGEFLRVVKALLTGQTPTLPNYPVCVECRLKENVCLYTQGKTCLGPIARAGCGAICPEFGDSCVACRGMVDQPNIPYMIEVLHEHGLTYEEARQTTRMFLGYKTFQEKIQDADIPSLTESKQEGKP